MALAVAARYIGWRSVELLLEFDHRRVRIRVFQRFYSYPSAANSLCVMAKSDRNICVARKLSNEALLNSTPAKY